MPGAFEKLPSGSMFHVKHQSRRTLPLLLQSSLLQTTKQTLPFKTAFKSTLLSRIKHLARQKFGND